MRILTTIDTIWLIEVQLASPNWTSHFSYEAAASLSLKLSVCAVLMSLTSAMTTYDGPLEVAHAHCDDDRYDLVEGRTAG